MNNPTELSFDLETTVPTDLTISSVSDDERRKKSDKRNIDTQFKERRQFIQELQLLRIDISRKNSLINNLQSDLVTKTETLEEKLKDALHQKQITQARLQTQLKLSEEEANHRHSLLKKDLNISQQRQLLLQERNRKLEETFKNLKQCLEDVGLTFSDSDFLKLKNQSRDSLSLVDYITLRFYEHTWSLKKQNDDLNHRLSRFQEQFPSLQKQLQTSQEDLKIEKEDHFQLQEKHKTLLTHFTLAQSRIEHGNYAQENYERVKCERDQLDNELLDTKEKTDRLRAELLQISQEKDDAKDEVVILKHSQALLKNECDHLSRQIGDLTQRWGEAQDKVMRLQVQLDRSKTSREELVERFSTSREKLRTEYEARILEEKNEINSSLKIFYEKEIRSLNEAKSSAMRQKEMAEVTAMELRNKYEKLYSNFCEKSGDEAKQMRKQNQDMEEKKVEIKKQALSLHQLQTAYQKKCLEKDKLTAKLQVLEEEYEKVKESSYDKILQLETELGQKTARLEIFDKLENELNEVVNEAAQVDELSAENILHVYGDQLSIPASARFSFIRCVNLTRKVMQLERNILSLQNELETEKLKNSELKKELSGANHLLDQTEQPYSYLISTVRTNESLIQQLKSKVSQLEMQLETVKKEHSELLDERNKLAVDLERVLQHREEITKMKDMLVSLQSQHIDSLPSGITIDHSGIVQNNQERTNVPEWYKTLTQIAHQ